MKVIVTAKPLAAMLGLAASLVDSKLKIPALWQARLAADGDRLTISANVLDFALKLSSPAMIDVAGELAVSASRLAALAASFASDSEITISGDETVASIACGRSRFKLPTIPLADLPSMPEITDEIGRIEIEREHLLELISKTGFAISTERARYYLNGILLHDSPSGLAVVATDAHRLARVILPGISGLSQDRTLIVPHAAIKIIAKLSANKAIDKLTLRRSKTLFEMAAAPSFTFVSKLIDATFPAYERILPEPSGNAAIVGRAELALALERIEAVTPATKTAPTVGRVWTADEPELRVIVPGQPDLAHDPMAAETAGAGWIAFQIRHGLDLLDALKGDRVRIDSNAVCGSPILITDPDDADFLIVQMPVAGPVERSEAAA